MKTVVSLDEFRKNLSDIVASVMYGNQTVRVQKHNKAGIVILNENEYEYLTDSRKRFTKEEWQKKFSVIDTIRDRISLQDQEGLEKEIDRAVREVRAEKKRKHGYTT